MGPCLEYEATVNCETFYQTRKIVAHSFDVKPNRKAIAYCKEVMTIRTILNTSEPNLLVHLFYQIIKKIKLKKFGLFQDFKTIIFLNLIKIPITLKRI
jgi:hypothetical protein